MHQEHDEDQVEDVIPEAQRLGHEDTVTVAAVLGFVVMIKMMTLTTMTLTMTMMTMMMLLDVGLG